MSAADVDSAQRTTCALCGRRAVEGAVFEVSGNDEHRWAVCPECRYRYEQSSGTTQVIAIAIVGVLLWLTSLTEREPSEARILVNGFLVWLMMLLTVLPHEFAHAFTARWLGLGTGRVHAGIGPLMLHGKFCGFPFAWRAIPLGGHTELGTPERPVTLPRLFLVYAAGPASHLLMAAAAWFLMGAPGWQECDPSRRLEFGWALVAANVFELFYNLKPAWRLRHSVPVVSDGLAMLQILFLRRRPFLPDWEPGGWWERLYPLLYLASAASGILGVVALREYHADNVTVLLLFVCCFACWAAGGTVQAATDRRAEDLQPENRGGNLHTQLDVKAEMECAHEKERLGSGAAAALAGLANVRNPEERRSALEHFAAEHADSFLPRLEIANLHRQTEDCRAMQTALEECLRCELPPAVHAAVLTVWAWAAVESDSFIADEVRTRLAEFRYTTPPVLEICCVLDALATYTLAAGCRELLPDAAAWTEETMRLAGGEVTMNGTRGGVLIETGCIGEGESLLRDVIKRSADDNDQAISFLYLAIAASDRGQAEEASALAGRARALLPAKSCFRHRLEREFPDGDL